MPRLWLGNQVAAGGKVHGVQVFDITQPQDPLAERSPEFLQETL